MNRKPKVNGQVLFSLAFEAVMAVLYLCFACILLFTHVLDAFIAESFRLPLGIVLALYGLYRVYRIIKRIKSVYNETE